MNDSKKPDEDRAARELEAAREHADPSKGEKQTEGGDRVSTNTAEPVANPGN
jgi:hypothetical protein